MFQIGRSAWTLSRAPHICIIGAGIAGLRSAEILRKEGVEVTIVEARNRIGGRTHQAQLGQYFVDMGPNWIHGTNGNPMVGLAEQTGTATRSVAEESIVRDEHGRAFQDETRPRSLYEMMWGIIADAFKHSHESPSIPAWKSLRDFFKEQLETKDIEDDDKRVILQMAEEWGHFIGSPVSCQSLRYFWLEESLEGENLFVSGTYRKILQEISGKALKSVDRIKLSTNVHSIKTVVAATEHDAVQVEISMGDNQSNHQLKRFDAAILTVPLGCLKAQRPDIQPPLNPRLQAAVRNLGYGNLEKAYITFPQAFWAGDKQAEQSAAFVNFLEPHYDQENNTTREHVDCMLLPSLPEPSGPPALLFYFHGEYARRLATSFSKQVPGSKEYVETILTTFRPYYSRLPHYDADSPACKPLDAVATTWSIDELAGNGSYTNFQVPTANDTSEAALDEDIKTIRKGLPDQGLWIAGEHTAPFEALGTITGAYWSGEKVARRVVSWFQGKGDPLDTAQGEERPKNATCD